MNKYLKIIQTFLKNMIKNSISQRYFCCKVRILKIKCLYFGFSLEKSLPKTRF